MVGRLAPPKRPDLALRAFASVRERIPEAELHVVGDGPLRGEAEALAGRARASPARSRFLGNRDDVPELLAEAECALLASDYEGCPLAVVEAMAASVAVVATEVGGVGELVRPGVTGALAAKGDAEALARALLDAARRPRAGRPRSAPRAAGSRRKSSRSTGWSGAWSALYEELAR